MQRIIEEKKLKGLNGWVMLFALIAALVLAVALTVIGIVFAVDPVSDEVVRPALFALTAVGIVLLVCACVGFGGFKVLQPNEALVLTLFGKYHGTLDKDGFFFVNPFCVSVNPAATFTKSGRRSASRP